MQSRKVGIVAIAQTRYESSKPQLDLSELAYCGVIEKVLADTGLRFTEDGTGIDATVVTFSDHWDGKTSASKAIQDVAGCDLRHGESVVEDGAMGFCYATMMVLTGRYDIVLLTAHCKESQTEGRLIENMAFDPVYERLLGVDFVSAAALQAKRYMYKYGITPEQCAKVVVKNKGNARNNPFAQEPLDLTVSDVLGSKMLCYPLHALDVKPSPSDGACAMILATEEKAKRITDNPVWVKGIGSCYDTHYLGDRDLADCLALSKAAQQAYKMAGITDPRREINVVELSEHCSYQELLWLEGLGFCGPGEGGRLIDSRATEMGGELPVNPSGGVLAGVPTIVAGLSRVAEAALQLQGEAGEHQVEGARIALAQGMNGACGQMQHVVILENATRR